VVQSKGVQQQWATGLIVGVSIGSHAKEITPVADNVFDLDELLDPLRAGDDVDKILRSVGFVLHALIEAEATETIGALPYDCTHASSARRNDG
jgi:hypothetical protein